MKCPTATEKVVAAMLRENTGRSFLDSGDGYGRNFERNASRHFETESPSVVSFRYGIELTHRLYPWLVNRLDYDEEASDAFYGPFLAQMDPDDTTTWGELRERFPRWLARWKSRRDRDEDDDLPGDEEDEDLSDALYTATGIYGEGEPLTINTYNEENLLEQILLFTYFELRSGNSRSAIASYVVLQLHGGCDARGGYTRPRVFTLSGRGELEIFDYRRGSIFCTNGSYDERHIWTTDDGSHWYRDRACGVGARRRLEEFGIRELIRGGVWSAGVVHVDAHGGGLCPICGNPLAGGSL